MTTLARHRFRAGVASRGARGFTLLEMAVSVSVIGVLAVLATGTFSGVADVRARARAEAEAEVARQAIRTFMLRNKRLPCPDLSADGNGAREGIGGSCPAGAQVGWLPYESLGLARPVPNQRMRYAVSRGGADLVAPITPGGLGSDLDAVARLRRTLAAAAQLPDSNARPYITGIGSSADAENCGHIVANPAFAVIAPVADRDDAGGNHPGFDGLNRDMAESGQRCIAAPARPMDATYDDVVIAESSSTLLGWLAAHTR
ncbi:prepilin-type N-terminal cleavage/methylation domain-containing protein [Luteimonas cucumeris]|uniref:Prepilin-type N-terminal cleavage/methylation domain-containing protein n=1 Tax=Luteimonas cucumeris TaxID=985012 RepID=A0A562LF42_9GAMM|nr:prepilin-type N-terminal cleavage/methylation domain-containing protein [Luteimonas cucumeris]TWI06226.1 prepilin-type N-terminal cleavage/methylation domain-containing protein [Luteimonas cucumeris]